jgi:phenylpropionate dioxygenase-like ring-hydroxylating dioxygenase large terminal subunit
LNGGLEEKIPKPGDYFTYDIGHESILVTRGDDDKVHAFYNVCPHRGKRLVDKEQGHSKRIACSYHGWRLASDGELVFVPCSEDFEGGSPCGKVNLQAVGCETFAGFVWVNMDPDCPTLAEHLGPVMEQIAIYDIPNMRRAQWVTLDGDFNWKCGQDNFNESYHLPFVHPQTRHVMEQSYKECQFDLYTPHCHARMLMLGSRPARTSVGQVDIVLEFMERELRY